MEEIDVSEPEGAAWIRAQDDPALWHQAAMAAIAYRGDHQGILPWLFEQGDMDRATAGWIFLWAEGSRYLRGNTDWLLDHFSSTEFSKLLADLCRRSESVGFPRDEIGLDPEFEAERLACFDVVTNGPLASGIVVPHNIIGRPFPPERRSDRYVLSDGIIFVEG